MLDQRSFKLDLYGFNSTLGGLNYLSLPILMLDKLPKVSLLSVRKGNITKKIKLPPGPGKNNSSTEVTSAKNAFANSILKKEITSVKNASIISAIVSLLVGIGLINHRDCFTSPKKFTCFNKPIISETNYIIQKLLQKPSTNQ